MDLDLSDNLPPMKIHVSTLGTKPEAYPEAQVSYSGDNTVHYSHIRQDSQQEYRYNPFPVGGYISLREQSNEPTYYQDYSSPGSNDNTPSPPSSTPHTFDNFSTPSTVPGSDYQEATGEHGPAHPSVYHAVSRQSVYSNAFHSLPVLSPTLPNSVYSSTSMSSVSFPTSPRHAPYYTFQHQVLSPLDVHHHPVETSGVTVSMSDIYSPQHLSYGGSYSSSATTFAESPVPGSQHSVVGEFGYESTVVQLDQGASNYPTPPKRKRGRPLKTQANQASSSEQFSNPDCANEDDDDDYVQSNEERASRRRRKTGYGYAEALKGFEGAGYGGQDGYISATRHRSRLIAVPHLTKRSRGRKVPVSDDNASTSQGQSSPSPGPLAQDTELPPGIGPNEPYKVVSGGIKKLTNSERPYVCTAEGCGKCFLRGEHLKRHVRSLHTWDKPHTCPHPGCGKSFSRRDNLGQHIRVHMS